MKAGRSKSAASGGVSSRSSRAVKGAAVKKAASLKAIPPAQMIRDALSIMGIPEAELTPKVRSAIMGLVVDVDRLHQEVAVHRARVSQLEKLADEDSLVPIANRRAFVRELSRMIAFAKRYDASSSLLYFDINDLKEINDTLGHAAGDAVIRHVGNTLIGNVRESDIVGRLGGDEFAILLANSNETAALDKAAALVDKIQSESFSWGGIPIPLRVAYGSYTFKGGEDPAVALDAADRAMYAHKQESRQQHPR